MNVNDYKVSESTESQLSAWEEGREAWYNGDPCYRQFEDTKLFWQAGYDTSRRADPLRLDAIICRSYDCDGSY